MKTKLFLFFLFVIFTITVNGNTITVLNNDNSGPGSLRGAIEEVNNNPGPHYIIFNIGSGPQTIVLHENLDPIINEVYIDGTTQGAPINGEPLITITTNFDYNIDYIFSFQSNSTNSSAGSILEGLKFLDLAGSCVFSFVDKVSILNNLFHNIGDPSYPYSSFAIRIKSSYNILQGNIIGTNESMDQDFGNIFGFGIYVQGSSKQFVTGNIIGGSNPGERNIVANLMSGIVIEYADQNLISRNLVFNIYHYEAIDLAEDNFNLGNLFYPWPNINEYDVCTGGVSISGEANPYDIIEIFGGNGDEHANEYLMTVTADAIGDWTASMPMFNWSHVVATATDQQNNTSQLSVPAFHVDLQCDAKTDPSFTQISADINYTSYTQWSGSYYIQSGVTVTLSQGAVLDITTGSDIVLGYGAKIIVTDISHIEANNVNFRTCYYKDTWSGIEFYTEATGDFTDCYFENAETVLSVNDDATIFLAGSEIRNCKKGIVFSTLSPNQSVIVENEFILAPDDPNCFYNSNTCISLNSTDLINVIDNNTFTNTLANNSQFIAIEAYASSFELYDNDFMSFEKSVYIVGESTFAPIHIDKNTFDNNLPVTVMNLGIFIESVPSASQQIVIENNIFNDQYAQYTTQPINLIGGNNIELKFNVFSNLWCAIAGVNVYNVDIIDNDISNCQIGIGVRAFKHINIARNVIDGGGDGVQFQTSTLGYDPQDISINDNCITNTQCGMRIGLSGNMLPTIYHNYIYNYTQSGLNISNSFGDIGFDCTANAGLNKLDRSAPPVDADIEVYASNINFVGNDFIGSLIVLDVNNNSNLNFMCNNISSTYVCAGGSVPRMALKNTHEIELNLFPNPNSGQFSLESDEEILGVKVFNTLGQIVYNAEELHAYNVELDISSQLSGIYMVEVSTASNVIRKKMMIQ